MCLTLFSIQLFAYDALEDFFSSSPEQIVTLSDAQDFLIGNIVHPLSGQPCLRQKDLVANGAQSIEFIRTYIPEYTPLNQTNGQISPSKSSYGGWVYFPHAHLNVFMKGKIKNKKKNIQEILVSVADPYGTVLTYQIGKNGKTQLKTDPWGISNGIGDQPSGRFDPRNTSITVNGREVVLRAPDGTKRFYRTTDMSNIFVNKEVYNCLYCVLNKEILPNGKVLRYQYNSERQVKKVESLDPQEQFIYASLDIDCSPCSHQITCCSNTDLKMTAFHNTASYFKKTETGRFVDLLYPLRLMNINSPNFKGEEVKYQTDKKNNSYLEEYHGRHHIFKCGTHPFKSRENSKLVTELYLPHASKDFDLAYSMKYALGTPGEKNSRTTVFHTDGVKTVYQFNANMLPEKVTYTNQNKELVKEKIFKWTNKQWLESITLLDGNREVISEKSFIYDAFGNPVSEILKGNLTGSGNVESEEIKRIFSLDGFNLLLEEEHSNGKVISYTYLPDTNLLTSRFVKTKDSACVIREFLSYDDCNHLISIIEDDGSSENAEDLANVSQRKITNYILRSQQPFLHMPEVIEVKFLENGTEKLLSRTQLEYDCHGNPCQEHVYDSEGVLVYTIKKTYDEQGNLLSETNALGQKATYKYDRYGNEKNTVNFSRKLQKLKEYDAKGRLIQTTEIGSNAIHNEYYAYDSKDRLLKKTDNFGYTTTYSYDLISNHPIKIESPLQYDFARNCLSVVKKATYDALGNKITSVDANGNQTTYARNIYGSPTEIIYPDLSKEVFVYETNGLLHTNLLQNGLLIKYEYDILENVISKSFFFKDDFQGKESFEYKGNKLINHLDLDGGITHYAYDGAGRKVREERNGCTNTYQYDSRGNVEAICYENGENSLWEHYRRDLLGRVLEKIEKDKLGNVLRSISYSYDADGNLMTIEKTINDKQAIDKFTYDAFGRQTIHEDPQGAIFRTSFDEKSLDDYGQRVLKKCVEDPNHITTVETFDPYGRTAKREKLNIAGQTISCEEVNYDACGNQSMHIDHVYQGINLAGNKKVKTTYDVCNRIKEITRGYDTAQTRTTAFTYTLSGNIESKIMPDGLKLNYAYDPFGNLNTLISSDKKLSHSFSYTPLGRLVSMNDELTGFTINRQHDQQGNVLSEAFSNGISIKKTYDSLNRVTSVNLPDGGTILYDYDPLCLRNVKRLSPIGELLYEHVYEAYDSSGFLLSENMIANLGTISHRRDSKGQLTEIESDYFKQECQYDAMSNLKKQVVNDLEINFIYDDLSQLTSELEHTYAYDSIFNRIQENEIKLDHNSLDEPLPNNKQCLVYDLRGNLIKKTIAGQTQTFTYDALNRLVEAVVDNQRICFAYDPIGRKISKTVYEKNGEEWKQKHQEYIVYDGCHDIGTVSEGELQNLRILGLGINSKQPSTLAIELEGKPYAAVQDYQGNIRGLIDISSKVIAASYDYSVFGKQKCSNEQLSNPWRYASKRFCQELELIDFGKRHYDPLLARWMTTDPAGSINSYNLYQYNFNNPLRYTDPDGQFAFAIPILCGFFGAGATGAAIFTVEFVAADIMIGAITTAVLAWGISEIATDIYSSCSAHPTVLLQEAETEVKPPFTYDELGDNPEICPGEGFEWQGKGTPASGKGSWVRGKRPDFETLHPDLHHPEHGPHLDYNSPQFPGGIRVYPNGSWEFKGV